MKEFIISLCIEAWVSVSSGWKPSISKDKILNPERIGLLLNKILFSETSKSFMLSSMW